MVPIGVAPSRFTLPMVPTGEMLSCLTLPMVATGMALSLFTLPAVGAADIGLSAYDADEAGPTSRTVPRMVMEGSLSRFSRSSSC